MEGAELRNAAERQLWDAFPFGKEVDLGDGEPAVDGFDPDNWGSDRHMRGEVLVRLLLGLREPERGYVARVTLVGARVVGELDLSGADVPFGVEFVRCWFDAPPVLAGASLREASFQESVLPGLDASDCTARGTLAVYRSACNGTVSLVGAHVEGSLRLDGSRFTSPDGGVAFAGDGLRVGHNVVCDEITVLGEFRLSGADIGGQLALAAASLTNVDRAAFTGDGLSTGGGVFCHHGLTATGEVRLLNARIGGILQLDGANLDNAAGWALAADGVTVQGTVFCQEGFRAAGEVRLAGAHVGGQVLFGGAALLNAGGATLVADGLVVDRDVICDGGFSSTGEARLPSAHIAGQLDFSTATLTNTGGTALSADRIRVDQSVFFLDGFVAAGELSFVGGQVGGQLDFSGAALTNDGTSLNAAALAVDGDMLFNGGFRASGEVSLLGARIGGQLEFSGAALTNPGGAALTAVRLTLRQNMLCDDGFTAIGAVNIHNSRCSGFISFDDATVHNPDGAALNMADTECGFLMLPQVAADGGGFDLRSARFGTLHVPRTSHLVPAVLNGLIYDDLMTDEGPPIGNRIAWLRRDPSGYHPQPYEQLATNCRKIGHDSDARKVLLAKERAKRRTGPANQPLAALRRVPGLFMDALSGYGYAPWRALAWLLAAVIGGGALLRAAEPTTPTHDITINSMLLALDAVIPTAPFGLRDKVTLTGTLFTVAMILQILGYALVLAILPAASRTLSRPDR
jgi:hypothetical protein